MHMLEITHASFPWLATLVALPAIAGIATLLAAPLRAIGRQIALVVSLIELVLAIAAGLMFNWSAAGTYQLAETHNWIPQLGISWALGVNQLSLAMILLAAALVPLVLVAAWKEDGANHDSASSAGNYAALVLILEAFIMLIFAARDVVLFYLVFEAMLIPVYFMIGRYGGPRAGAAALKFLLYSLASGLVMLGGVIALVVYGGNAEGAFLFENLANLQLPHAAEMAIFATFFVAFAVKAPMVPVHTWLPDAAEQARPGTSVLLVGVLDKLGTYGMITLCLPLFPHASAKAAPVILALAVISILYGGLAAIGQKNLMRLISYTSVSHFGFMVLGIYIGTHVALVGAMYYMVAHGISIAAMFLISGFLTQRRGSRTIADFGGWQRVTPVLAGTWLVTGLASIALPTLSGFVPEYLVLVGTWQVNRWVAFFAVLGVILAALYVLIPYQRMFTGPVPTEGTVPSEGTAPTDASAREKVVIAPLIVAMVIFGVWAAPLVQSLNPVADTALSHLNAGASTSAPAHEGSDK